MSQKLYRTKSFFLHTNSSGYGLRVYFLLKVNFQYSDACCEKHLLTFLPFLCPKGGEASSCHMGLVTCGFAYFQYGNALSTVSLRGVASLYCRKLVWCILWHQKKRTNLPIFTKSMIHFCTDIIILIKKKYIRQRLHIIMDFLNTYCL